MARAKVSPEPVLCDWDEADDALREIGQIDREVAIAEARMNKKIEAVKAEADEATQASRARKARLAKDLGEFSAANRADFGAAKTRQLTFGEVSYRITHKLKPVSKWTWGRVLEHLEGLGKFVRITPSVNRDELRDLALAGEDVAQFGVRLCTTDEFGYKVNQEVLDEQVA